MLVTIVYVPDAARRAPDTTRIGKVEDLADDLAQKMLGFGEVRLPTDDELAAYHAALKVDEPTEAVDEPAAASKATKARDKQPDATAA